MYPKPPKNTFQYQQAWTTIEDIIKLNRDKLYLMYRKEAIKQFKNRLKLQLVLLGKGDISDDGFKKYYFSELKKMKDNSQPSKQYSFFWNFLYQNIHLYINSFFKTNVRVILNNLTTEFKKQ